MKRNSFSLILFFSLLVGLYFLINLNKSQAQILPSNDIYMFGTIENDHRMSGYFGKNSKDLQNKDWCVFIGANGKVYKITLIERNIHELFIDGKKITDSEIWKHNAEYKTFLQKFWRNEDLRIQSRDLEQKMRPLERKIEAISKEIEALDQKEEKLSKEFERNSINFAENKKTIRAQQKRLNEIQSNLDQQIEELSDEQEKVSNEQESLNLMSETEKILQQISEDLQSLGVIKSSKNLSFKLSNIELILNGKKVTKDVFDLLKTKYIVELKSETGFLYRWKGKV